MWSLIELLSAAICCHLPPLRPLLRTVAASKYWSSGTMFLKEKLGKIPSLRLSVEKASGSFSVTLIIRRRGSDDGLILIELSRSDGTSATMPTSKQVPVPTSQLRRQSFSYSVTGLFATVGAARRDLMLSRLLPYGRRGPVNQTIRSQNQTIGILATTVVMVEGPVRKRNKARRIFDLQIIKKRCDSLVKQND